MLANPMLSKRSSVAQEPAKKSFVSLTFMAPVISKIAMAQKDIKKQVVSNARDVKSESSSKSLFALLLFVFLYGVIHALGPGHGKVIATSYFMGEKANIFKGIIFGFVFSLVHSVSALVLFLSMKLFSTVVHFTSAGSYEILMQQISFFLVAGIGAYMVYSAIRELRKSSSEHSHFHGVTLPFAIGLVPCPGTLLFLTFFSSLGMFWFGVMSVFIIAAGMAVSLSIISVLVILFRETAVNLVDRNHTSRVPHIFSIISGVLLVFIGLALAMSL